jgi:glycerol-3-phosphate acyltransferase PlsY
MLQIALALVAAYLIGAIPFGVVLTRLAGVGDVRASGSGNIGATNVYRTFGRRLGLLTLAMDALKGLLPVLLAGSLLDFSTAEVAMVAAAAFLGHCYPIYLGFKGGKGVATALGIYLVLSPLSVLGALLLFAAILWRWRYVSLASVSAAAAIPLLVGVFERSWPLVLATLFISVMVIVRHRANIERLRNGTESKFKA